MWGRPFSLRVRLASAMVVVLLLALSASTVLDRLGEMPGVSRAQADREPYQDGLVLACFSVAALLLIWLVSSWSLRPLGSACREAASVGPRHPGLRLTTANLPAEIHPLLDAVNSALERMEVAYEAQRRFTTDAAHELRTPLSVLSLRLQRARLENALDWDALDIDVRHMTRLVQQLLDLARKEQAGREPADAPVNLSRVAREAAAIILPLAEAAGRTLTVDLPDTLPVRGRADDLRDAVLILLDNALTHGRGNIEVRGAERPQGCVLSVADDGPAMPLDLRHAVFERFRKAQPGSAGTGLGLAILREVIESHAGSATFLPGENCVVEIHIPIDDEPIT